MIVLEYMIKNGYVILERNYKEKCGEIDLISEKDGAIVFTEVKSRGSKRFGEPIESVTPEKISSIIKTAELYLSRKKKYFADARFDVAVVAGDKLEEYIPNAFTRNDAGRKRHW